MVVLLFLILLCRFQSLWFYSVLFYIVQNHYCASTFLNHLQISQCNKSLGISLHKKNVSYLHYKLSVPSVPWKLRLWNSLGETLVFDKDLHFIYAHGTIVDFYYKSNTTSHEKCIACNWARGMGCIFLIISWILLIHLNHSWYLLVFISAPIHCQSHSEAIDGSSVLCLFECAMSNRLSQMTWMIWPADVLQSMSLVFSDIFTSFMWTLENSSLHAPEADLKQPFISSPSW